MTENLALKLKCFRLEVSQEMLGKHLQTGFLVRRLLWNFYIFNYTPLTSSFQQTLNANLKENSMETRTRPSAETKTKTKTKNNNNNKSRAD